MSQSGGGPKPFLRYDRTTSTPSTDASSIAPSAAQNGTTKITSMTSVMTVVANARLLPTWRCTHSSKGQVATTIAVAHTSGPMKAIIVHRLATSSTRMMSIRMVARRMSGCDC